MLKQVQRMVQLPGGRSVTLGEYVRSWHILRTLPPDRQIARFNWYPMAARDVLRELRRGMHDRINRHIPGYGKGRKWDQSWQTEMRRAANDLNQPRLVIHYLPADLSSRFPHRLAA